MKSAINIHLLVAIMILSSCRENTMLVNPLPFSAGRGVFIVNEGLFPNPGTLAYYSIESDSVFQNVVGAAAGWITPNDVQVVGEKAYIVVNGNDRIEVLNTATFHSAGSIRFDAGTSPGFLAISDSTTGYVANYSGTVCRVNLRSDSVVGTTGRVVAFPGGIAVAAGKVYVSDVGLYPAYNHIVRVLDASSLLVLGTISVGDGAGMMTRDSSGNIYVVCAGNYPSSGIVYAISALSDQVVDSISVGVGPSDIAMLHASVVVLHGDGVMRLSTSPLRIADSSLVKRTDGLYFYAMNVDPSTGDVYISKIVSAGGSGEVEVYTPYGSLVRQPFGAGVFPGAFGFAY